MQKNLVTNYFAMYSRCLATLFPFESNEKIVQSFGRHKSWRILPIQPKNYPNQASRQKNVATCCFLCTVRTFLVVQGGITYVTFLLLLNRSNLNCRSYILTMLSMGLHVDLSHQNCPKLDSRLFFWID